MKGQATYRIGAVGRVVTGKTPSTADLKNFGPDHPFLTPTDMRGMKWARNTERGLSSVGAAKLRGRVPARSVAVSCIGWQMGKAILTDRPTYTNQQINTIIPNELADPDYLYYYFATRREELLSIGSAGGVRTPIISKSAFEAIEIKLPELPVQRRIGSILSAYDDLIENNTQRIVILEEMARRVFDEWFVHFRPRGDETVRVIQPELGSTPKGWSVAKLGSVLSALEAGTRPKGGIDPNERGVPSIGAENICGLGNHDYAKEKFVSRDFFQAMRRGQVRSGDVLLYKDGAYIGRKSMFRDGYPHGECAVNEHVFILRPTNVISSAFLYFWLDQESMTQQIRALNANAAQPGINQPGVNGLPVLVPPSDVMSSFTAAVEPMLGLLFGLARKNRLLRQTRDLLLPKLISGEMDVSEIPEPETICA